MLKKLKQHQFLIEELVSRDFKKKYKGTVLGMGWSILSPLLMLLVMKLVFTHFFGARIEHYTTFLFSGNLIFSYFNESTTQGMTSLRENAVIFSKINVPKYLFLLSKNVQTLINFAITLAVYFVFCAFDGISFTWLFLTLIFPVICLFVFNAGIGLILSGLFMFFKDMRYLWTVFLQLLMYASCIFYSPEGYTGLLGKIFYANPVYCFIYYFRSVVIGGSLPPLWLHGLIVLYSFAAVMLGGLLYKKHNHRFLYYV